MWLLPGAGSRPHLGVAISAPVITTVALKQLATVLFAHEGGGCFLKPLPLARLCLTPPFIPMLTTPSPYFPAGRAAQTDLGPVWRILVIAPVQQLGRWLSPLEMRVALLAGRPFPSLPWPICLRGRKVLLLFHRWMLAALLAQAMDVQTCV